MRAIKAAKARVIEVQFQRGLYLPGHDLWLDPHLAKPLAFVSHAHGDHIAAHDEVIASSVTAALMRERLGGPRVEHLLEFGRTEVIRGMTIALLPAGHIFGSTQFYLEDHSGSLLYTGDFKLRPGLSAEPAGWRQAETLVMETTFGLPKYRFPPTEEVLAQMVTFCRDALEDGEVPVLLGYSLGKAQEILCALSQAGLTPMLHGSVFKMTRIYQKLRAGFPCDFLRYAADQVAGKVLICPPSANRSLMLTRIRNRRVAVMTGWALDPGATFRYQCDAAFPLSDHADYPDLLRYVELVQPKRVLTLHGFAAAFARDLRDRGIEAWALSEENQLELSLAGSRRTEPFERAARTAFAASPSSSEFAGFAALGEKIGSTTSKLKKIALLRDYLRGLGVAQLPLAAIYLTGHAFAQGDPRTLQVGWAVIRRAVLSASGLGEQRFREISRAYADAGRTTFEALIESTRPEPFTLAESGAFFALLQRARGPLAKIDLLRERLARLSALEGSYVVRILTGDLRIGLREGLVEEAIAAAFAAEPDALREANMLLGDIGQAALLARENRLHEASLRLFIPIKCMLASPEPTAGAIWKRLREEVGVRNPQQTEAERAISDAGRNADFWVEDKFDGIRAQLHRNRERVEIYTRDLKCVTGQFPEIAAAARGLPDEIVLDGEIIASEGGRTLSFFDLQKRLGRKAVPDFFLGGDIPVQYLAFDLLWLNGRSLLKTPLAERRRLLDSLSLLPKLNRIEAARVHSAAELDKAFHAARSRRNEGLMIKDAASLYTPGRRGLAWLKLKKELATLDVVVVRAEMGHGKRAHVLSDYTFAVRDDDRLLTIGKAYSGLTDVEIEELTEHFKAITLVDHGWWREVVPDTVLEVAFDSVQPSTRHESGLALRFPRIKAIRRDKTPAEIDTLAYARSLV